ncbi:MAG TPA: DUF559 domain-containing protein [Actinomycetes bacterium]|nr:DUF559 domain-containing protein [Actinomycetes bacterium]
MYAYAVLSHTSAAEYDDLPLVRRPDERHLTVPRACRPSVGPDVHIWWADLKPSEVRRMADPPPGSTAFVTAPTRTVLDCARYLPFREALVVADAAVRRGLTTRSALRRRASRMRGPGSPAARQVAEHVDRRSESPLESMQRGLHILFGFGDLVPQVLIEAAGVRLRADFADVRRKIVVETEGATHRTPTGLAADVRRYTALAVDGWLVVRFTWAQVVFDPAYVVSVLRAAYAARPRS